jgi:carbamoyl-phosphate synthase large subunit
MTNVLVTGGGGAGSEALRRLLEPRYALHFGDADVDAIDPAIPEDRRHQLPMASVADFVEKTLDLCRRLSIDLLVPGVDEELLTLAVSRRALAPTRVLVPDADYVRAMTDKLSMVRTLSARHISVPLTRTLADGLDDVVFPCIAKPRTGRGSRDVRLVRSCAEASALRIAAGAAADETLLQEKIEGVEYSVQMIASADAHLCGIVPVRIDVKRGITLRGTTEADPLVIEACRRIHESVPAGGCYNIQLIRTPQGRIVPFEINPRISTTLCLTVAAGIDPIAVYLELVRPADLLPFTAGVQLRRHWTNHLSPGAQAMN